MNKVDIVTLGAHILYLNTLFYSYVTLLCQYKNMAVKQYEV